MIPVVKILFFVFLLDSWFSSLPAQVRFCAVGDILLDRGIRTMIGQQGVDYPFGRLDSLITRNDIALFNLECPLADTSKGFALNKKYCFRGEPEYIKGLIRAGFNVACVANNHTTDFGKDGLLATLNLLHENRIYPVGAGITQREAFQPLLIEKNGETFAIFALLEFLLDATMYTDDQPYPAFGKIDTLCALIREYNSRIDNIIVTFHWGYENTFTPNSRQRDYAHQVIMAGADLVLGHHPHVLQSIEIYRDRIIAYSLGNFVFDNPAESQKQSVIFQCGFQQGKIIDPHFIPVYLKKCRPHPADTLKSREIFEHLQKSSVTFNTPLTHGENGKISIPIPCTRPVKEIHYQNLKFDIYTKQIKVFDDRSELIRYNFPDSIYSITDAGYHVEESIVYFYAIVRNDTSGRSRVAVFPYTLFANMFLRPSLDQHDEFNPWKILLGDMDGDSNPEVILGVNKRTRYSPELENRIFIFNRDKDYIYPKWLGSKIGRPFLDFKLEYDPIQKRNKLILLEKTEEDTLRGVIRYVWNGFGFDQDLQLPELKYDREIRTAFQLSDFAFVHPE
jgi:poly-gamma-glutamate capsule biosynthesis protein CapA/YwtB (metallophosphatase superfamily)